MIREDPDERKEEDFLDYLFVHLAITQGKCCISEKSNARPQCGGSGII